MATFKVYHGGEKPLTAQGKNQVYALQFAAKYPGWHSYANDRATRNALQGLIRRGSIVKNKHGQFSIAYSQFKIN